MHSHTGHLEPEHDHNSRLDWIKHIWVEASVFNSAFSLSFKTDNKVSASTSCDINTF